MQSLGRKVKLAPSLPPLDSCCGLAPLPADDRPCIGVARSWRSLHESVENKMKMKLIVIYVLGRQELSDTLHGERLQRDGLGSVLAQHEAVGRWNRGGPSQDIAT